MNSKEVFCIIDKLEHVENGLDYYHGVIKELRASLCEQIAIPDKHTLIQCPLCGKYNSVGSLDEQWPDSTGMRFTLASYHSYKCLHCDQYSTTGSWLAIYFGAKEAPEREVTTDE